MSASIVLRAVQNSGQSPDLVHDRIEIIGGGTAISQEAPHA